MKEPKESNKRKPDAGKTAPVKKVAGEKVIRLDDLVAPKGVRGGKTFFGGKGTT